jgi:hypothetical protein
MADSTRLLKRGILQTRITVDSYEEWAIHRSLGPINWTHGFKLQEAPGGASLDWEFQIHGPDWMRPFLFPLVGWEASAARYRIWKFKRKN